MINNTIIIALIAYVILPIILAYKSKVNNTDLLNVNNTTILKGIFALYIAIHHYVLRINGTGILTPLNNVGILCVSFFFLMSGYGLTIAYNKNNSLKGFFKKRLLRLYFPFVIGNIIVAFMYNISGDKAFSLKDIVLYSFTMRTINEGVILWYVFVQALMYLVFYISFKFFKEKKHKILCIGCLSVLYILISIYLNQGQWRYNTVLCFLVGVIIGEYINSIVEIIKRKYISLLIGSFMIFCISWLLINFKISAYQLSFVAAIFFIIFIVILTYKISFKSKVFYYLGKISYEIYIIQLPVVNLVYDLFKGNSYSIIIILLLTILCAAITNVIAKSINSIFAK